MGSDLKSGTKFPRFKAGDRKLTAFSARALNRLVDLANAVLAMRFEYGVTPNVVVADAGIVLQIPRAGASTTPAGTSVSRFKLKEIKGDYLRCVAIADEPHCDGATTVPIVNVAKSSLLRTSVTSRTAGGITINYTYDLTFVQRTAHVTTLGFNDETHVVTPHYVAAGFVGIFPKAGGDDIYAAQMTVDSFSYLDMNIDGRMWQAVPVQPAP